MQLTDVNNVETASILDKTKSRGRGMLNVLTANPKFSVGLGIVVFFVLVAICAPLLTHYNPDAFLVRGAHPPSSAHILGTTNLGQDAFAQLVYGARVTLLVSFSAAIGSTLLQILFGLTSAYFGGFVDDILTTVINVVLVLPGLPLAIVIAALAGSNSEVILALVLLFTSWPYGARVLRSQTLSLKEREFIGAARASGERAWRIVFTEILPNEIALVATTFIGTFVYAITTEVALEFLGLGDISRSSWGVMLYWVQSDSSLMTGQWWLFIPPGLCIALLCTGLAFINFGIDELANPRLRREPKLKLPKAESGALMVTNVRTDTILEVENVSVDYMAANGAVHAVDNVSFTLKRGEIMGLAGESGSGKSTLAYAITRLLRPPAVITGGSMFYYPQAKKNGEADAQATITSLSQNGRHKNNRTELIADGTQRIDILGFSPAQLRAFRWSELSIVFQSAMNALNPVITIGRQMMDVLQTHQPEMPKNARKQRAIELLKLVGIAPDRLNSYPHELSGGMRQRAIIAIALALSPDIIIMDEPTTALDVVVQREILTEIIRLREEFNFSVIFITHDLSLLLELADKVAIMYAGKLVELSSNEELYHRPRHPYSYGLLHSFPSLHGPRHKMVGIPGTPPDLRAVPPGCAFHPRCPFAFATCREVLPGLLSPFQDSPEQLVACHLYDSRYHTTPPTSAEFAQKYEGLAEGSEAQ